MSTAIASSLSTEIYSAAESTPIATPRNALPATASRTQASATAFSAQVNANVAAGIVRLTPAQQVRQLYSDGNTVPQIASRMDLSAQAVDQYLNISSLKG
jgi:DNA-binding NarL/FixJ family response regulator